MTIEPSILRQYRLGDDVSRGDPTITSSPDNRLPSPKPPLKPNSDQAKVTVVEFKDLKADHC
jgi:protein-disulfide isomerase